MESNDSEKSQKNCYLEIFYTYSGKIIWMVINHIILLMIDCINYFI